MEEVHGDEGDDGDAEAEGGGDEGFADAAGDFFDGEFRAADAGEGTHDACDGAEETEERAEGDDGVHGGEEAAGALEFVASGDFEGALEGTVAVVETVVDHADDRVFRGAAEGDGVGGVAGFDGGEDLVEGGGVAFSGEIEPPCDAFDDDADREDGGEQDGVHDGAAAVEEIDEGVGEDGGGGHG